MIAPHRMHIETADGRQENWIRKYVKLHKNEMRRDNAQQEKEEEEEGDAEKSATAKYIIIINRLTDRVAIKPEQNDHFILAFHQKPIPQQSRLSAPKRREWLASEQDGDSDIESISRIPIPTCVCSVCSAHNTFRFIFFFFCFSPFIFAFANLYLLFMFAHETRLTRTHTHGRGPRGGMRTHAES